MTLEPNDAKHGAMKYKCVICNAPTSRMLKEGAVCTKCFVAGWGRLDHMPLPSQKPEEPEPPLYVSEKDKRKSRR